MSINGEWCVEEGRGGEGRGGGSRGAGGGTRGKEGVEAGDGHLGRGREPTTSVGMGMLEWGSGGAIRSVEST